MTGSNTRALGRPWRATAILLATAGSACASAPRPQPTGPRAEARVRYDLVVPTPNTVTVGLSPSRIGSAAASGRYSDVRLYLGGIASPGDVTGSAPERLALVLLAARDSADPVLREDRGLLLEVDGRRFRSSRVGDDALYRYARTELGYTETVLFPIDRQVLASLIEADVVAGRLGAWLTFELSRETRDALASFLEALPAVPRRAPTVERRTSPSPPAGPQDGRRPA